MYIGNSGEFNPRIHSLFTVCIVDAVIRVMTELLFTSTPCSSMLTNKGFPRRSLCRDSLWHFWGLLYTRSIIQQIQKKPAFLFHPLILYIRRDCAPILHLEHFKVYLSKYIIFINFQFKYTYHPLIDLCTYFDGRQYSYMN